MQIWQQVNSSTAQHSRGSEVYAGAAGCSNFSSVNNCFFFPPIFCVTYENAYRCVYQTHHAPLRVTPLRLQKKSATTTRIKRVTIVYIPLLCRTALLNSFIVRSMATIVVTCLRYEFLSFLRSEKVKMFVLLRTLKACFRVNSFGFVLYLWFLKHVMASHNCHVII